MPLTGYKKPEELAGHFGYGSEYGQYFSPLQEGLLGASTQAGWSGYRQAKAGEIGQQFGLQSSGLLQSGRRSLLDLTRQRQQGGGGFAGSGAAEREYGRGRSQLMQGLLGGMSGFRAQRGASMFGLEQDILSRISGAQGRIEDWRARQQDVALRLLEMEAKKTETTTGRPGQTPDIYAKGGGTQGPVSEQRLIRRGGMPDPNSPVGAAFGDVMTGKDGKQYVWTTTGWQLDEGDTSGGGNP